MRACVGSGGGQCHQTTCLPQQERDGTDAREASVPTEMSAKSVTNKSRRIEPEEKEAKESENKPV